ncbi:M20/M25/M40 family metallo-hydrolase [Brevundimonas sp.]|uniref:M20/M25/M40 family metallo-hydrolase n=1 Tax=Brevundimonas sp. TaxID=1871086 RepID=UPI002D38CCFD|nr:M20/M25/M40 family metallo-hydrolase [Brevundimonas sp.]HYD27945.1 M20/M25/M40 family metallo-hydrolase [Brevundimonas sp.]
MRLFWLVGSLALALLIGVASLQVPEPAGVDAPATAFSAGRAMTDVRELARRPHPVGSADHARVGAYLLQRLDQLGLETSTQGGPLSAGSADYLRRMGGDPGAANFSATNLIGVLPGRNPALPAVALMVHYDTVPMSPGAADDSTGVAAVLESVRAIRARGPADRTLVVILTDAEEIGLDGARAFWGGHPLRDRIGAVINLEARGGGGRAMMFQTGSGNAETIALFARAGTRADGGVTSNSLAVFVYERMPNDTDFSVSKDRGVPGLNLAFIGRPEQYHAPSSTPGALDRGAVQHIGSQTLENADALLRAGALPARGDDAVYADLFGRVILSHPPAAGWGLLAAALALLGAAAWRASRRAGLTWAEAGRGAVDGVWFLTSGLILTQAVRTLAGPLSGRDAYYTLLARLPWMEAGAALAVLALGMALLGGRGRPDRRLVAIAVAAAAAVALTPLLALGGLNPFTIGVFVVALIAGGLSLAPGLAARTAWGGWTGLIALVLVFAAAAQALAPQAAFLFLWPALLAAATAALAAVLDPGLTRAPSLAAVAVAATIGGAWLIGLSHPVFLGVGLDLPGVLVLMGLLVLMLVRPLSPERGAVRPWLIAALAVLVLGGAVSAWGQVARPMAVEPAGESAAS